MADAKPTEYTEDERTGKVVTVQTDEHVTDPDSPEAVQTPDSPAVDGSKEDSLAVHRKPTPLERINGNVPDDEDEQTFNSDSDPDD